jgi:predicted membrane channel-forming protein YqfA (hemolysin III family)
MLTAQAPACAGHVIMKRFGFKRRNRIIFGFAVSISSVISLAAAFVCQKDVVEKAPTDSVQFIVYLPSLVFFVSFLFIYHAIKALICWHILLTQKKLGQPVSFGELWRHSMDQ